MEAKYGKQIAAINVFLTQLLFSSLPYQKSSTVRRGRAFTKLSGDN